MIEWIIGGAVLYALGGGGETKNHRSYSPRIDSKPKKPRVSISQNPKYSDWCEKWKSSVDVNQWIPKGKAKEIIQEFPPFENESHDIIPTSKHSCFEKALNKKFDDANVDFSKKQKERLSDFFSSVEINPLTDEQKDCCICMDSAVQIVAAAGSGKTSTIIARVGYALKENLVSPNEILILAFNRSVQKEIETRIMERLGYISDIEQITVKTFHAFGLEVIGKSTGRKPRSADWVEPPKDIQTISDIVEDLCNRDPNFKRDWNMFRVIFGRDVKKTEVQSESSLTENGKGTILTADGKQVKSEEERMICDFLFYYGVPYEYERPYEYDTVTEKRSQYRPDFYYPRIKLYHEHFALDKHGNTPSHFSDDYTSGVLWKRNLHNEKNTRLFETTSYGLRSGNDLEQLKFEIEKHGEVIHFDENRKTIGPKLISTKELASTIRTFQQHVKNNQLSYQDLHDVISKLEHNYSNRLTHFVKLYEKISDEWQRRLQLEECVDFDDMVLNATRHIESGTYQNPYNMVLADEFQDVSQARLSLLKALKDSSETSVRLCVVGDDWQGINRFAGADISVMTGFDRTFPNATQLTLSRTFRCHQVLCDASSDFIQKNPKQIKKTIESTNTYERAGLYVFAAENGSAMLNWVEKDLKQMFFAAERGELDMVDGKKISVMLLGRYNNDKPVNLSKWQRTYGSQLEISFSTVHSAKGMEADYIMILNVVAGGFPSQIDDDPVLQIAMPDPDDFSMAEERRLFYVALTRARRQTRIYTLGNKLSEFIIELVNDGHTEIKDKKGTLKVCPKCGIGTLKQMNGKFGPFEGCNMYPKCDYTKSIVPAQSKISSHKLVNDDLVNTMEWLNNIQG